MQRRTIVIIGGGVAGSMLAVQLTRLPGGPWPLDVLLVETRPHLGPGTAYSNNRPEWLLNVRSGGMSAFPDEPDHFVDWLQQHGIDNCPNGFCPRQTYGRYLSSLVEDTLAQPAANGVRVQWLNTRAVAAEPAAHGCALHVILADGRRVAADTVVLALGNFPPPMPVQPADSYRQHPHFHANPWAPEALSSIRPDESVLLVGTGLTALDTLVALHKQRHRAPILAVSRHGHWPAPHASKPVVPYPNYYADKLAGLRTVTEVLRAVRRQVALGVTEGFDWRAVLDAPRPDFGRIWAAWPREEQQRFLRHLATRWSTLRHRNPPANAAILTELLDSGQLQVHHGCVQQIEPRGEQLAVELRHRTQHSWLVADHVVLCTGPLMDYQHINDPLVTSLRNGGLLVPDALRLGIRTNAAGALLNQDGQASECLYTLGSALRPLWFESTAVPELRRQAADLAATLAQRFTSSNGQLPSALRFVS
ncbi:FAD/NAD(P)-binding protein [Hymenobacter sp. CRA2]|uniref:FAD/NAD(P)-binding protein n=1 Tax=Hymenobacter sp. CRA2 TaxID=1955620 RepID=UPI0011177EDB|nr:FAD/NAD(P)-binding protein [Hymenobacter sp. CRA2]